MGRGRKGGGIGWNDKKLTILPKVEMTFGKKSLYTNPNQIVKIQTQSLKNSQEEARSVQDRREAHTVPAAIRNHLL